MSIFTDLDLPLSESDIVQQVAVSNVIMNPSIAVISQKKIQLFNERGDKHDYELSRNIQPCYMEWHPNQPTIAIGWENGTITLWSEESKMAKEECNVHKDKISIIVFNPTGSRMVTADDKGNVVVWRGINQICQYKKEGIITHCIFCELNMETKTKTSNLFFFGGKMGIVSLADDQNHCSDVCKVGGAIRSLLYFEKENSVIIITSTLLLVQFKIQTTEKTGPDKKVKLSIAGDPEKLRSIWIGTCLLATCSHENMLRMWHLEEDENYVLTLHELQGEDEDGPSIMNDKLTCIDYEKKGKVLVAGTKDGRLIFWKNLSVGSESPSDSEQWKVLPYIPFEKQINNLSIGKNNGVIAVHFGNSVALVSEVMIQGRMSNTLKLLQSCSDKVQIYLKNEITNQMFLFDSKEYIRSIDCSGNYMLLWTSKQIEIYEIICNLKDASTKQVGVFKEKCLRIGLHGENVILGNDYNINIATFKGAIKQNLSFPESEGKISNLNIMNSSMVIWTQEHYIRIFDLSRREYKQVGVTRKFEDSTGPLGLIRSCAVNSDGSKVVIIADQRKNNSIYADTKFYIYDVEMDNFISYDCGADKQPLEAYCDRIDKRFFGILQNLIKKEKVKKDQNVDHTKVIFSQDDNKEQEEDEKGTLELTTFFVTSENGIKKQDTYQMERDLEGVFAISLPCIYFIKRNPSNNPASSYKIQEKQLNDFIGLDKIDDSIKEAIMNFSFYLSTGNLDEAYKSVKSIQNPAVWEKMAQMCVKTKRLDVAEICLGNMRFARGSRAIRESKKEPELEAQLAMVAIQLKMDQEAQKMYEGCKRYDLLNKMLQSQGEQEKAIQVAENFDRINLKNTYFQSAKMYEVSKNFEKAIIYYEKSGTYKKEVTRMLFENKEFERLEKYIESKQEKELYKWWAQYLESRNNTDQAFKYYNLAQDYASTVRILCQNNDFKSAKQVCLENNDPAACYFLAKQLELAQAIPEAIQYYAKAQYFTQAVKLAREKNMHNEVMSLSLQATKQVKLKSAAYFEEKKFIDKAIELYKKGGNLKKALDMAQKANLREEIDKIQNLLKQKEFEPQESEGNIQGDFDNGQPEKAIPFLIQSKQYERALDILIQNNLPITDDFVKKIIPDEPAPNPQEEKRRNDMLMTIADHLKKQGNFALASQYYIKVGDKVKAMKCLINLGTVDKVITFAQNARQPQIFILAGNFLQTADWHKNPELMKHIINFYNKAKAYEHLAGFFDACSQVEIDEYRDYEKAIAALKEAMKHAHKSTAEDKDQRIQQLQQKMFLIEKFVQAKNMSQQNPEQMLNMCQDLINNPNIEMAIRAGDVFAHIIEFHYDKKQYQLAFEQIKKMQEKGIILAPYLDQEMLQTIFDQVGYKNYRHQPQGNQEAQDIENFQEEAVIDEDVGNQN